MNQDLQSYIDQLKKEEDIFSKSKRLYHLVYERNVRIVDIAKSLGKTSSYICHLLRLANLPEMVVDGYYAKLVSLSHLFIISRIKDSKKLLEVYEKILKESYTVQETEELVREVLYEIQSKGKRLTEEELKTAIEKIKVNNREMDIKVVQTRIKGKAIIEMKGSLEKTSAALKDVLAKLIY